MSLIADALKTAQREKQRHASGAAAPSVPLLVPLRSKPTPEFSWRRAMTLGAAGAIVLMAGFFVLQRAGFLGSRSRLQPVVLPPVIEPVDTIAHATLPVATHRNPLPTANAPRAIVSSAVTSPPLPRVAARAGRKASPTGTLPAASSISTSAPVDTTAVRQAATSQSAPTGRLRIAVDPIHDADAVRLFQIGVAAHHNGDFAGARNAYEAALAISPEYVDVLNNLGLVLLAEGDAGRAEIYLRRAISLAPRNGGAWNNLGAVLRSRGRTNDAIAAFQHALNIDPSNEMARVNLAQQYVAIGSLDQARGLLIEATAGKPDLPEAQYTLGQVLEQQGDKAGAIHAFREFLRIAPPRLSVSAEQVRAHLATLGASTP